MDTTLILAANSGLEGTRLGNILFALLRAVGFLVVMFAIVKIAGSVMQGKIGTAVKMGIGTVVVAAIMFQPALINTMIEGVGRVVDATVSTFSDLTGGGSSTTPTTTP